ncbi:MAG: type IVB secretion system protein IcmH/DotU [Betaproteobacteria bacterium]
MIDDAGDDFDKTRVAGRVSPSPVARAFSAHSALDPRQVGALAALNPILAAANPLLNLIPGLRTANPPADVALLRQRMIDEVREFDAACARSGVPDDQRQIARYALCTVMDEAIQATPWGGTANWAQQSLLINFHGENWGGEKFFQVLNKLAEVPARYPQLIELFYVCLSLGFMGRFRMGDAGGRQALGELREKVYQIIRQARGEPDRRLAADADGVHVDARRFSGFGLVGAVAAALLLGGLATYAWALLSLSGNVGDMQLETLTVKPPPPTAVALAPAARPRLAQLLSAERDAGQVDVRDLQLESVVTITGERLFESGSATPAPGALPLLAKIAAALDGVEGKVLVTGHTDDVPTRTLRFPSNWELSAARANNVAAILRERMRDPGRVSAEGRGDTETIAPNASAEGRAMNRRVEIVLRAAQPN